ncbi:DUF6776 family protein [Cognatiluteimonas profundi]|uniref:DUF6776 family protein n=1 Tax=Cognatiluteimonas profundi TaxID=2594501 RepID=UPI001E60E332|nr:DUF6776 family protein [Lysobacter profundi]
MIQPSSGPPAPQTPAPASGADHHPEGHGLAYALIAVFLLALAFGGWGAWRVLMPPQGDPRAMLRAQQARIDALEQRTATLARSDQISRDANRDLQGTLAERDEEIAGLRADVAFYQRFVGSTAQRRGLNVHALHLQRQTGQAWHFTATLTQNLNRGAVNRGQLMLSVEGSRDGHLQRLDWPQLRQQASAPGVDYSFKYFQQAEGDILLPPGLSPVRVIVRLQPDGAAAVEQSFTWAEAIARPGEGG